MDTPSTNAGPAYIRPRGIDVALAMARERLAEAHFQQALAFIEVTGDDLSPPRALSIYARLHHLSEEAYRALRNRVLASFGEAEAGSPPPTFIAIDGDVEWDVTASLYRRIRRRLGGRRNFRLRKRVELFSGRVEAVLLGIHVDCVCRMTKQFDPNTSVAEVVRIYMDELSVRRTLYPTIYLSTLTRLYAELEAAEAAEAAERASAESSQAAATAKVAVADAAGPHAVKQAALADLEVARSASEDRPLRLLPGRA